MSNKELYDYYSDQLGIDRDALDDAIIEHSALYNKVGAEYALAISRRDEAKLNAKEAEAEALMKIREGLEKSGEKFTESKLSALVLQDKDVAQASRLVITLTSKASHWGSLKDSFEQRGDLLKSLVHLHVSGYFGNSSISVERAAARESKGEAAREMMAAQRMSRIRLPDRQG